MGFYTRGGDGDGSGGGGRGGGGGGGVPLPMAMPLRSCRQLHPFFLPRCGS